MASIRKRVTSTGAERFTVMWRDPDTGQQRGLTVDTSTDAEQLRRTLDANGQSFTLATAVLESGKRNGPTVEDVMFTHFGELTRPNPGTIKKYESIYKSHFKERMGHLQADEVTHGHVVEWVKWMQGREKSPKTIANAHAVLSAAMTTATRMKIRPDNPCAYVSLPRDNNPDSKTTFLTRAEYGTLHACTPEHYKDFVAFLAGTGMRFGEATALNAADFSLDADVPVVRVEKAWKIDDAGRMYLGAPKTRRSRRVVSLDPGLTEKMRARLASSDGGLVFTSQNGGVLRSGGFHNYAWKPALKAARSLETGALTQTPRPHDLRHTHASWLIQEGLNIFTVSRRLGHESITTTMDRYGHLMPEALRDSAEAIGRVMR